MPSLTNPRWEAFCRSITQYPDRSLKEHYERAGFSVDNSAPRTIQNQAWKLHQRPEIKARIAELREFSDQSPVAAHAIHEDSTKEDILRALYEIVNRCMQAAPAFDKKGNPTGYFEFDARNAVMALRTAFELQGANLSVLFRRQQKGSKKQELEAMTAEQLVALGRSIAARLNRASGIGEDRPDDGAVEASPVPTAPEAGGVSRAGQDPSGADPDGGEPIRQIGSGRVGGSDAPDRPVPEVVEWPEVSEPDHDVGGWTNH